MDATEPTPRLRPAIAVAATTSALAGLVHAVAAGSHGDDPRLVRLFALTALAQLGWAALAVTRPRRPRTVLALGAALGAGAAGAWLLSRTVGLPLPALRAPEEVGAQDLGAALLAAASAAGAVFAMVRAPHPSRPNLTTLSRFGLAAAALVVAFPLMAADHVHGEDHGEEHAAHDHGDDHHGDDDEGAVGPIVSVDDPRLSAEQQMAAQALLDGTTASVRARFPTPEAVLAAGYRSIGDGRRSGFEHLVHPGYLADGRTLEPAGIEPIVLEVGPDGTKEVASAMYILELGSTMDDVPDIAGELTTWHDHQNLCWRGDQVAGVVRPDGQCPPGSHLRATAPMLHVWLTPQACGPFTGIEGHGDGDCTHAHTH